jgi:signal transduction histidine kinase
VGVLGLLLERETPLRLETLSQHPASAGMPAGHPRMENFLGVPIRYETTVLGSIYLAEKVGGFSPEDERTIQALSMHLAVAIRNWQLLKRQRALVAGLISAQEEERRAVAYDLHDGLTQYVMAAHMHIAAFQRAYGKDNEDLTLGLTYLRDAVVESRRLVNGLRSLALDDMGLAGALSQLVQEEKARAGWDEADFLHNVEGERFAVPLVTAVYRVAQEALTNARKHSEAQHVQVTLLRESDSVLMLCVRDNGKGFDPARTSADDKHIGLHGIAERVRLLEGILQIESALGSGTQLTASFPVQYQEG